MNIEKILNWCGRAAAGVGAYLMLNSADVNAQTNINIIEPTDYNQEIIVNYDFDKDGLKEYVSAVDTANMLSYGYILSVNFSDGRKIELDKTNGQIYGIAVLDDKITYFLNKSEAKPEKERKSIFDINWLFEQREIEYDGKNFSRPVATGVSTDSPWIKDIEF